MHFVLDSLYRDWQFEGSTVPIIYSIMQCLSQDLETGCLKLAVVKFWGVQISKGDHNVPIFQP